MFSFKSDDYGAESLLEIFKQFTTSFQSLETEEDNEQETDQSETDVYNVEQEHRHEESKEVTSERGNMTRQGFPVILAATPGSGTTVRSIRYAKGTPYNHDDTQPSLPINGGSEAQGESIVIDFSSPLFVGTFMMRIAGVDSHADNTSENYFDGKQRRFQAIVRGKFLKQVPAAECVTGQVFDRSPKRLPPLTKPFLRAVSAVAPHMEIDLYAKRPYVLSSLVSTAKTLNQRIDGDIPEDSPLLDDPSALSGEKSTQSALSEEHAVFEANREYTFEFYQHMLDLANPQDFVLTFAGWSVRMGPTLDGQPIRILGAWQQEGGEMQYMWSFDLMHENHQLGSQ